MPIQNSKVKSNVLGSEGKAKSVFWLSDVHSGKPAIGRSLAIEPVTPQKLHQILQIMAIAKFNISKRKRKVRSSIMTNRSGAKLDQKGPVKGKKNKYIKRKKKN